MTLVSYAPKKGKLVTLLSSMHHHTQAKEKIASHTSFFITMEIKGVDAMDKLAYTVRRKCNRWQMTLFFNMLNIAGISSFIIWILNHPVRQANKKR